MSSLSTRLVLSLAVLAAGTAGAAEKPQTIGRQIADFSLRDYRGKEHRLADVEAKLVVVAFIGTECPLAKVYGKRLAELQQKFADQGVAFLGIDANQQDSISEIAHYARQREIAFPVLKDVGNKVADQFAAQRTPEVFVLDADRKIRYHGRIDDEYQVGVQRSAATRHDLAEALEDLLAGKPVSVPTTKSIGCYIGRVRQPQPDAKVTYSNQIARTIQKRCIECHREGEIAPFALSSYDEVAGWAETMAEVIQLVRMPPWHASPKHGHFSNAARMPDEEKQLVYDWVKAGAPQGDPADLPEPRQFTAGWRIPKPDLVVSIPKPYTVPAAGEVKYQYFEVDPGFKEDKWVQAAECRPDNRGVVHHIIVYIKPPGATRGAQHGEVANDWLAATAPGAQPMILPEGLAKLVPAGSTFVFQMHYTPNGSVQKDQSSVGIVFADPKQVKKEVGTRGAANHRIVIPPGVDDYTAQSQYRFHRDTLLLAMFPHMHLRGKAFRYVARYPDDREEVLLEIPNYDFNWQNGYVLAEPKVMPAGTRLVCTATYDNSQQNLANPDPTQTVRWGDQTWEEMMIGYFDYALVDQDLTKPNDQRTARFAQAAAAGKLKLDDALRKSAGKSLESDGQFTEFALALQKLVPQLDRICLTKIEDEKLHVVRVAQGPQLMRTIGGKSSVKAAPLAITGYAQGNATVIHQNFTETTAPDLVWMRRGLSASLHVPVKYDGAPATINFWSREQNAFPKAAQQLLEQVVQAMIAE